MAEPKAKEGIGKDSQDQDNHELKSPTTDKGNKSQPPPLSYATSSQEDKYAKGGVSEDEKTGSSKTTHNIGLESTKYVPATPCNLPLVS